MTSIKKKERKEGISAISRCVKKILNAITPLGV